VNLVTALVPSETIVDEERRRRAVRESKEDEETF
jgi:hypothetical protein